MIFFQSVVKEWLYACFGPDFMQDRQGRNQRFFEEATECVQAGGMSREDAHMLVDYVYDRPVGELHQEIGGAVLTLAALCIVNNEQLDRAAWDESLRAWQKIDQIREKQKNKPKGSPLPGRRENEGEEKQA